MASATVHRITDRLRWTPSAPLDLELSIDRYRRWGDDLATVVHAGHLYRVAADGAPYRVSQLTDGSIEVAGPGDLELAMSEVHHRLAEGLPRTPLDAVAEREPAVRQQLAALPGYRPPMNHDVIESLVSSICAQQVNLRWAATTRGRLVERYGVQHELDGVTVWRFPSAAVLAKAKVSEIRAMQFTQRKAEYIVGTALEVAAGRLDDLESEDDETVIERITAVRGLGRWTAEWFLARSLARPGVIAAGDLGVRKAISAFVVHSDEVLPEPEIRAATADWGDGANWAMHLLLERLSAG